MRTESTAVDKLRDEALRGRPALWIRRHGALRAELPAGVARLYLPTRSSEASLQYSLAPVAGTEALTLGPAVTPEARAETAPAAASYAAGRCSGRRTHGPITRLTGGRI